MDTNALAGGVFTGARACRRLLPGEGAAASFPSFSPPSSCLTPHPHRLQPSSALALSLNPPTPSQTSQPLPNLPKTPTMRARASERCAGAATFAFVDTITKLGADVTYAALLEAQYAAMKVASGAGGHNSFSRIGGALKGVVGALKAGRVEDAARAIVSVGADVVSGIRGGSQSPVISCSEKVDIYHTRLRI